MKRTAHEADVIRPGYGSHRLHLGQTEKDIRRIFGKPDHKIGRYKGVYFYQYLRKGFDLNFGKKGGKVQHINFFCRGVDGHRQANVFTAEGLKLGDTRARVLHLYGKPDRRGQAFESSLGWYEGASFEYRAGLFVKFGSDQRVDEITVFRPKIRSSDPAPPASHEGGGSLLT